MKHITMVTNQCTMPAKASNDSKFVFANSLIDTAANGLALYDSLMAAMTKDAAAE